MWKKGEEEEGDPVSCCSLQSFQFRFLLLVSRNISSAASIDATNDRRGNASKDIDSNFFLRDRSCWKIR